MESRTDYEVMGCIKIEKEENSLKYLGFLPSDYNFIHEL
jgi:hypothetical protein